MSPFTVRAETSIMFEIEYERDGKPEVAILQLDGGEWRLTPRPQAGAKWLGSRRIDWPEALKRALVEIAP